MSSPNPLQPESIRPFAPHEHSFTSLYLRLRSLKDTLAENASMADEGVLDCLEATLADTRHAEESLAPFMYRLCAECLVGIMAHSPNGHIGQRAEGVLRRSASPAGGRTCLAAAQALGSLPVSITPAPEPESIPAQPRPAASCLEVFHRAQINPEALRWAGRSLIASENGTGRTLVLKCAVTPQETANLRREAFWMERLKLNSRSLPERFDIPDVHRIDGSALFFPKDLNQLAKLPARLAPNPNLSALAFEASRDYFVYPNDPAWLTLSSHEDILEVITRSSKLFGWLTGLGIIHAAPIPLFHNRTQQTRREDGGVYLWQRAGRLDRWLWTCRYPNFGLSGLRDFEHFRAFDGATGELFREAGNQILSLALVAASCFRFQEPDQYGLDSSGQPKDLRHLFDAEQLEELLRGIAYGFFEGFVGRPPEAGLVPSLSRLCRRMIEEMGLDRTMMEILRLEDQAAMDQEEFIDFLRQRGFSTREAAALKKGQQELSICTGPHLGDFNRGISLPELIDFTAGTASMAIAGRFLDQLSPFSP